MREVKVVDSDVVPVWDLSLSILRGHHRCGNALRELTEDGGCVDHRIPQHGGLRKARPGTRPARSARAVRAAARRRARREFPSFVKYKDAMNRFIRQTLNVDEYLGISRNKKRKALRRPMRAPRRPKMPPCHEQSQRSPQQGPWTPNP